MGPHRLGDGMELSRRITAFDFVEGPLSTEPLHRLSDRLLAAADLRETLLARCAECGIGSGPVMVDRWAVQRLRSPEWEVQEALRPGPGESVRMLREFYRRGHVALAELRTCFVPERLLPGMGRTLARSDVGFGPVVAPLRPRRSVVHARFGRDGIEHRVVLATAGGPPIAVVLERFMPVLG